MEFDYSKLRGRIREILGTEIKYGQKMGFSTYKKNIKLNGKSPFTTTEILLSCEILEIPIEEIYCYFFVEKVRKH